MTTRYRRHAGAIGLGLLAMTAAAQPGTPPTAPAPAQTPAPAPAQPPAPAPAPGANAPQPDGQEAPKKDPLLAIEPVTNYFESAELQTVCKGLRFGEGPLWFNGELAFCDLIGNTMLTIAPGMKTPPKVLRKPSDQAAGLTLDNQGRLLAAHFSGYISRQEKDGTISTLATACDGVPLAKVNDLVVRSDGMIFFTDFGDRDSQSKGLFRLGSDGKVVKLYEGLRGANGLAFSPDEKTLYVNEYLGARLFAMELDRKDMVETRRVLVDFSRMGGGRPDGLKVDEAGNIYTTGPEGIYVVSPGGQVLALLSTPGAASNLCFGGEDRKTMFVTAGARVFSVRSKNAGLPTPRVSKPAQASPPAIVVPKAEPAKPAPADAPKTPDAAPAAPASSPR